MKLENLALLYATLDILDETIELEIELCYLDREARETIALEAETALAYELRE